MGTDDHDKPDAGVDRGSRPTLDDVTREVSPQSVLTPEARRPGPTRGSLFGRYVVLELLGAGGMGEVYAAVDPELGRKVALKLVRADGTGSSGGSNDPTGSTRLLREAQALARLSHPNVVSVYDVGVVNGQVFLAMELVTGQSVKEWLAQPRSWREVLNVFCEAGKGLAAAHEAGLIHRDFKPDNILFGSDQRVRVVDFGLARSMASQREDERTAAGPSPLESGPTVLDVQVTQGQFLLGTPSYMAPEHFRGQKVDHHSDQFSFCVALYRAIEGTHPFSDDPSAHALFLAVTTSQARPPARVPDWVWAVLARGLSVDPEARYPSMGALLQALARDPWVARRKWLQVAAVTLLVTGAVGGAAAWVRHTNNRCQGAGSQFATVWDDARRQSVRQALLNTKVPWAQNTFEAISSKLDSYAHEWTAQHTETCEATWVRGEQSETVLNLRMRCLAERRDEVRALVEALEATRDAIGVIRAGDSAGSLANLSRCRDVEGLERRVPLPTDSTARASITALQKTANDLRAMQATGRVKEALPKTRVALEQAQKLAYLPLTADLTERFASQLYNMGQYEEAEKVAFAAIKAAWAAGDEELAYLSLIDLIDIGTDVGGRYDEFLGYTRITEALLGSLKEREKLASRMWAAKCLLHSSNGKNDLALRDCQTGLAAAIVEGSPDQVMRLRNNTANAYEALGQPAKALELHQQVLAFCVERWGQRHPDVGRALNNIGNDYFGMKDQQKAFEAFQRAWEVKRDSLGPEHPSTANSLANLGNALRAAGKLDEAQARLGAALGIYAKLKPVSSEAATTLDYLGLALEASGKTAEALKSFDDSIAMLEKLQEGARVEPMLHQAETYLKHGKVELARGRYEEAVAVLKKESAPRADWRYEAAFGLARVAEVQGRLAEGQALAQDALQALAGVEGDTQERREAVTHWLERARVAGR